MDPFLAILASMISYLLGAISFARLIPRLIDPNADLSDVTMPVAGTDEKMRMSAMGANTASIKYGSRVGCTIGLLDMIKVFVPVLAFRLLYPGEDYQILAALSGFIGHCWPIYHKFKGGRGISAFYGGMFALDPIGAIVIPSAGMFIGMVFLKDLLVAYMAGVLMAIPWFLIFYKGAGYVGYAIIINVLFVLAMIPELRDVIRLRKKYGKGDMRASMDQFPMGQAMNKLMDRIGISRK
jgi:glycerol-3-phosphate acyltransferase PlsY